MSTTGQDVGFADRPETPEAGTELSWRVVVTSPGSVDMAALSSLANALKRPVAHLAKTVYHAPSILLDGINSEQAGEISDGCRQLGLETVAEIGDGEIEAGPDRFDVAVYLLDPEALTPTIETMSRVVGVPPDQAYRMLATPPGLLIGGISQAAATALADRFGPGVELRVCQSGAGPFDLYLAPDTPATTEVDRLCGSRRGLVPVGLDHAEAEQALACLPKGSVRVVARDLVRFDLVLEGAEGLDPSTGASRTSSAAAWLSDRCGVVEDQLEALARHAPIALKEGLRFDEAGRLAAGGLAAGLALTVAPAGFDRYGVTVCKAADMGPVGELALEMDLPVPSRLPALLADGLSDLEARCLAHCFEQVGAIVSFEESR